MGKALQDLETTVVVQAPIVLSSEGTLPLRLETTVVIQACFAPYPFSSS